MNILILTARFGMGHIKAAEAVKEQLDEDSRYDEVKIIDFVEYFVSAFKRMDIQEF